ncbi:molybdopterin molybdotransferase MoeA [Altericroceibacterium endophyticum]|uniref:Molybdopterin molybdenumtransferase n=1 Tax=Altericroceibacterium endophyticum TaxID=1808508 RepID=A0A6I4T801_9SPHN|nr:molybdopterin molybdotransferase MoeA [Altericroceibacterium endophyticum]MXO65980.1 molybdopterin molybdenumtransferase MoeA [Altericroceibacterium endophyticum]
MTTSPALDLAEAQKRLLGRISPLGSERLPLSDALGRYLAEPVMAVRTQPPADLSAMDGYAMRAGDFVGPWNVVGESAAGHPYLGELAMGETIRISTGALLPRKAGAILLQEDADRRGDTLSTLNGEVATARHIRRAGFDFEDGDTLLSNGHLLNAQRIALIMAGGLSQVAVHHLPKIAIMETGDELSADPGNCTKHQIPASNGTMIAALARPLTSQIDLIGPVADDPAALSEALGKVEDVDILVTCGGASVGDHDLVRPALEAWGAKIDFWRVAIKPGKPIMVARRGRQLILGLPGNPVSGYVTAFLFLLPVLRAMAGAKQCLPQSVMMPLRGKMPVGGQRLELQRGRLVNGHAEPLHQQDSSALAALSQSDLLILGPRHGPARTSGAMVECYQLQNGGIA